MRNLDPAMREALQTFIIESRELLASVEDALMLLEQAPDDADAINAAFRAIHTIKGSAGMFGLDDIVRFAHVVENVLDRARNNTLRFDDTFIELMLACGDHLGSLVELVASDTQDENNLCADRGAALLARLGTLYTADDPGMAHGQAVVEQSAHVETTGGGEVGRDTWHISLRFGPDVLRDGMDPASILRYLWTLGDVVHIVTLWDTLPDLPDLDPESCFLNFEIDFKSEADKQTIEGAFEFVRDNCQVHILPPNSKIEQYLELIEKLPESNERIGEILIASGVLTPTDLQEALERQQASPEEHPPLGEILVKDQVVPATVVEAALAKQQKIKERQVQDAKSVRVDAAKLEGLINLVGEMVIAGASVALRANRKGDRELNESVSIMQRLVEDIRDSALSLRMVEIGETFHRFQRVVRDVSRELGKEIELATQGNETELDKLVVEKINDPLLHLIRNAMDHGIETPEVRRARGKSLPARVTLNAYHESGGIVIEVADDGGGLNRTKILQRAIERGIVAPTQNLSDKEIFRLIFEPGFSTAETVTNLSGRGVGMDVVRKNIEALRGTVNLDSQEGLGTTVRIRLPLTLAIIDGFLFEVGDSSFVVPLDRVTQCLVLAEVQKSSKGRNYLDLHGEVLPFVRLRDLYAVEGNKARRENVVVVSSGGQKAGLVVDRLLGQCQTVIKPLGSVFSHLRGIAGSTILGSGEVALILDVPATVNYATALGNQQTTYSATRTLSLQSEAS